MLVNYTITFEKGGLAITQSIEDGSETAPVKPGAPVVQNALGATSQESGTMPVSASGQGGGPDDRGKGGGPDDRGKGGSASIAGGGPITIIGPFIFLCCPEKPEEHDAK